MVIKQGEQGQDFEVTSSTCKGKLSVVGRQSTFPIRHVQEGCPAYLLACVRIEPHLRHHNIGQSCNIKIFYRWYRCWVSGGDHWTVISKSRPSPGASRNRLR